MKQTRKVSLALGLMMMVAILIACGGGAEREAQATADAQTAATAQAGTATAVAGGQATVLAQAVMVTLTAEAQRTPTPDTSVTALAQAAFTEWATANGEPYRDEQVLAEDNDGFYAHLQVVAWFRPGSNAPWEERAARVECRQVGGAWQCDQWFDFSLTQGERTRRADATSTAVAHVTATAEIYAQATATAVAHANATAEVYAQATATAAVYATATAEVKATATRMAQMPALMATAAAIGVDIDNVAINPVDGAIYFYVPAGEFSMGSTSGDFDEQPVHTVYLDSYWIMRTEVTNELYGRCVAAGGCTAPDNSRWQESTYAQYPVTDVDWQQAVDYATWAGGRLPTEAEWEKACRGMDQRTYPWGNAVATSRLANFNSNVGDTIAVGSYEAGASPYGLLDMAGNAWEWTADRYGVGYYASSPTDNPAGPSSGDNRVLRGGAFFNRDANIRCSYRSHNRDTNSSHGHWGFRVVPSGF